MKFLLIALIVNIVAISCSKLDEGELSNERIKRGLPKQSTSSIVVPLVCSLLRGVVRWSFPSTSTTSQSSTYCEIKVYWLMRSGLQWPVVIDLATHDFIELSNSNGDIVIPNGATIRIACPGNRIRAFGAQAADITCDRGQLFSRSNIVYNFYDLGCDDYPEATLTADIDPLCPERSNQIALNYGFSNNHPSYVAIVDICYNQNFGYPLYTKHFVKKFIQAAQIRIARPMFSELLFNAPERIQVFSKPNVQLRVNSVWSNGDYMKYFNPGLSEVTKGHLAPKADFIFGAQQRATFFLLNASPQLSCLNAKNWEAIENLVRHIAHTVAQDLTVFTGTFGELGLNGNLMYLSQQQMVPIPLVFWKVVQFPNAVPPKNPFVFVGFNLPCVNHSPWHSDAQSFLATYCIQNCGSINWLTSPLSNRNDREDYSKGFIACCEFAHFANKMENEFIFQ